MAVDPQPRPRQPLGSQSGFKSSPKGQGEAANKAAVKPGTNATLPPGDGRGPPRSFRVLACATGSQPLTSVSPTSRDNSESHQSHRDFPAPRRGAQTVLARQPQAQPPQLGKTNPGGGGEPGWPEGLLRLRGQPWQPSAERFEILDWRGSGLRASSW